MFWFIDKKEIKEQLNRIEELLVAIHNYVDQHQGEIETMALDFRVLADEVARLETVHASATMLLKKLVEEVEALKDDPVELQALVDRIRVANDGLVAAVMENTPSAPVVEEIPVVEEPVVVLDAGEDTHVA